MITKIIMGDGNNTNLGPQAMFQCRSGECVSVVAMCRGYSLCRDRSDLEECNKNLRCVTNTWSTYTIEKLDSGHHYCQYHETDNDGEFDNIGRKDEVSLNITSLGQTIQYWQWQLDILYKDEKCGSNSLRCGNDCVENYEWCRNDRRFKCGNQKDAISSTNEMLCGLPIWDPRDHRMTCDIYSCDWERNTQTSGLLLRNIKPPSPDAPIYEVPDNGTYQYETCAGEILKTAIGRRCSGKIQHCYYPWYNVLYTFNIKGGLMTNCLLITPPHKFL